MLRGEFLAYFAAGGMVNSPAQLAQLSSAPSASLSHRCALPTFDNNEPQNNPAQTLETEESVFIFGCADEVERVQTKRGRGCFG